MGGKVYKPLAGVKVLAFEIAFALPAGTRTLAELGAEVVRVPPPARDVGNYIGVVDGVFLSKPCISIDLTKARGRALARQLALEADVVCDNFRSSVLGKYGLSPEELRAEKPELIVLKLSGYGVPGPWTDFAAFGPSVEAAGGMNRVMGGGGRPVGVGSGVFADQLAGRYAALALISALRARDHTGQGRTIDLSMVECISHLLGPFMVRASKDGDAPWGDVSTHVPDGSYPCRGEDEWIAITVKSDAEWRRLATFIGDRQLMHRGLSTRARRAERCGEIDAALADWTREQDKNELADTLQGLNIAAAPVRTVSDMYDDPQIRSRGAFQSVAHRSPVMGFESHPHVRNPWRVRGRERQRLTDFRYLGQDNEGVLKRWLGLSPEEIRALKRESVLVDAGGLQVQNPLPPFRDPEHAEKLALVSADDAR